MQSSIEIFGWKLSELTRKRSVALLMSVVRDFETGGILI